MRLLMTVPSFSLPYCAFFSSPSRSDPQIPVQNVKDLARPQRQSPSRSRRDSASGDHHQRRRSHSSSRHRSHHHDSRSDRRACWGCGTRVPEGKSLCDRCYARAVREKETETQHLESLVKRVVQQSLKELDSPHMLSQSTVLSGPRLMRPVKTRARPSLMRPLLIPQMMIFGRKRKSEALTSTWCHL